MFLPYSSNGRGCKIPFMNLFLQESRTKVSSLMFSMQRIIFGFILWSIASAIFYFQ